MVTWNLEDIISKVRNITGTPISNDLSSEMSDELITSYINSYYTFTMPFELKEQINLQPLNFFALPNIDVYSFPSAFLTDQPMAYADGFPLIFYQDRDIFFQDWPQQYAQDPVGVGDGITDLFVGVAQNPPIIRGTFLITDGEQVAFDKSDGSLYQTLGGVDVDVGNINYVTGGFDVTFDSAPAISATIYDKYQGYQPARPQGVLWYNNVFTFRPIPDQVYQITMQGYINQTQFDVTNQSTTPLQTEWGQLIAYGASLEIFSDRGDLVAYNNNYPILKRYENVALGRTVQQYEASQSVPRF
jgi:hypothetical protein